MLTPARNSRELHSTSSNPLYILRVKTKAGTRAFSVAAPTLWNSLPVSVKSEGNIVYFHRRLKNISLMLPILLSFLEPSSIHQRLTHCSTFTQLLNPLVLSRHWAWSSRILAHKNSLLLLLLLLLLFYDSITSNTNLVSLSSSLSSCICSLAYLPAFSGSFDPEILSTRLHVPGVVLVDKGRNYSLRCLHVFIHIVSRMET